MKESKSISMQRERAKRRQPNLESEITQLKQNVYDLQLQNRDLMIRVGQLVNENAQLKILT